MNKKFLTLSLATCMIATSFNNINAFANENNNNIEKNNKNKNESLIEIEKKDIIFKDGQANYHLEVYINKNADIVEKVVDKSKKENIYGYFAMIWGEFKYQQEGLSKYNGKSFSEIENMPTPKNMTIMGNQVDLPSIVHKKIIEQIKTVQRTGENKEEKISLAKALHNFEKIYVENNKDLYEEKSLNEFNNIYKKTCLDLKDNSKSKEDLKKDLEQLNKSHSELKPAVFSKDKYNALMKEAEEKLKNESHYSITSIGNLKQKISEVKKHEAKNVLEIREKENILQNAINGLVTVEEAKMRFSINANLVMKDAESDESMANQFLVKELLLIEKDNKKIYNISFKKDKFQGITAEVLEFKYQKDNQWITAKKLNSGNENIKTYEMELPNSDIDTINVKFSAYMGGDSPTEKEAVLKIDKTTKRGEGEDINSGNKAPLIKTIQEHKEIYEDVLAGLYKEEGANKYLKKYQEALKTIENKEATEDNIEDARRGLLATKQNDLILKSVDTYKDLLIKAESLAEEKNKNKYGEKCFAKLKEAVASGNAVWTKRNDLTKQELNSLISKLDLSIKNLKTPEQEKIVMEEELNAKKTTKKVKILEKDKNNESMANVFVEKNVIITEYKDKTKYEVTFTGFPKEKPLTNSINKASMIIDNKEYMGNIVEQTDDYKVKFVFETAVEFKEKIRMKINVVPMGNVEKEVDLVFVNSDNKINDNEFPNSKKPEAPSKTPDVTPTPAPTPDVTPEVKAGWKKDDAGTKYQKENGSFAKAEWEPVNGTWYHFDENGYMQTGWLNSDGTWYYLNADGSMAKDTWIGTYYVDANGSWIIEGWQNNGYGWWYQRANGTYPNSEWEIINGIWYYFDENGYMLADTTTPDGYYVDENGAWVN